MMLQCAWGIRVHISGLFTCRSAQAYLDVGDCQWVGESLQQGFIVAAKGRTAGAQRGGQAKCTPARLCCASVCQSMLMQLPGKAKLRQHCSSLVPCAPAVIPVQLLTAGIYILGPLHTAPV